MKTDSKLTINYMPPRAEEFSLSRGLNVLSSMSLSGDVNDYEEGGIYDGVPTNGTSFTNF